MIIIFARFMKKIETDFRHHTVSAVPHNTTPPIIMTAETKNTMIINLDDTNLPTEGDAWEAMLEHVREYASNEELLEGDREDWMKDRVLECYDIGDLFEEEEILEYVREQEIPIERIYDSDVIAIKHGGEIAKLKEEVATLQKRMLAERSVHAGQIKMLTQESVALQEKINEYDTMEDRLIELHEATRRAFLDGMEAGAKDTKTEERQLRRDISKLLDENAELTKQNENLSGCVLGQQKLYDKLKTLYDKLKTEERLRRDISKLVGENAKAE